MELYRTPRMSINIRSPRFVLQIRQLLESDNLNPTEAALGSTAQIHNAQGQGLCAFWGFQGVWCKARIAGEGRWREQDGERESGIENNRDSSFARERERARARERERESERARERESESERAREHERESERERARDRERAQVRFPTKTV